MSVGVSPLEIFRAKGVPHRRLEDWKYSDLRSLVDAESVSLAPRLGIEVSAPAPIERAEIGADGLPEWASVRLGALSRGEAMEAAARAFEPNGVALRVPAGSRVLETLRIAFEHEGHGEILLFVEQGASLTLLETHHGAGEGLRNISVSIFLEHAAQLTHVRQAPPAKDLVSVETIMIHAGRSAHYRAHFANLGARLSRTEIAINLAGEGAEAELSGVTVLGGDTHSDITTRIDHSVGHTTSRQVFKMVAGGHSRAVYQGKIVVHKGADDSDSRQTAKALLLGARAEADLKPELEIFADDVKCAHGAAAGDLDADSLFYLRARGIPENEARTMLIRAFLEEIVDAIGDETVRAATTHFVEAGLAAAMKDAP